MSEPQASYKWLVRKRKPLSKPAEAHPWRLCPAGQHYRRATTVRPHARNGKPVRGGNRSATCAKNPSGRDQLYSEEMQEIAGRHFGQFKATPLGTLSEFKKAGNAYDDLIQGWTQYWNEVLKPADPLDPKLIKALIASESGFSPKAWNHRRGPRRARGLMQVTDKSLRYLTENYDELDDHFLNLTEDEMLDPNFAICAGIRWLFRKKEWAEKRAKKAVSWRDAVAAFKGIPRKGDLMDKFDSHYDDLNGKKK